MTKEELLQRLTDIEWDDFEAKEALDKMPDNVWEEIANLCGMSVSGVKYHLEKLRKSGKLEWQGHSRTGKWVIKY